MFGNKPRAEGSWLVTGAASGFGREAVRRLTARGESVVALDRAAGALEELEGAHPGVHAVVADVTDPEAVRSAVEAGERAVGPLAHVFHSAGVLAVGPVETMDPAELRRMIEINYLGSVHVAQATLPSLRARRGRATLTFVASVAGLRGFPLLAGYSASKFAVFGFAQALRDELARTHVAVRVLCPPPGDTPMVRDLAELPPVYRLSPMFSAEEIVGAWLRDLDRPGLVQLVDLRSKALWRVSRVMPSLVDRIIRIAS